MSKDNFIKFVLINSKKSNKFDCYILFTCHSFMINLMKHILFYPNVESILPRSTTQEALKRVETYLPVNKLKAFDSLAAILWEFVTGEIAEEHSLKYGR